MSETPKSKFSMWFNCQSENEQHKYWSVSEITVDEVLKLYDYDMDEKNLIKDYKGNNAIKIRAKMMPATSNSGNNYMKMVISDYQKPSKNDKNEEEF